MEANPPSPVSLVPLRAALPRIQAALCQLLEQTGTGALSAVIWKKVGVLLQQMARTCRVPADRLEDIVHDVWLDFLRHRVRWTAETWPANLGRWFGRVMKSKAADTCRQAKRHRAGTLDATAATGQEPVDPQPAPEQQLDGREIAEIVRAVLEELRPQVGGVSIRIIEMFFLEEGSDKEIAAELGLSEGAVRVRRCRLMKQMHKHISLKELWKNMGGGGASDFRQAAEVTTLRKSGQFGEFV